ncbi:DUF4097 family beta strand repeat-containing protein [Microbacterium halophytorum]|uniref:hypothetical protein n=1 Tax=Microbacterium halophytorum TaxID=2067568 RepID=UPI000CFD428A|nr:hypothetical protein [Microbacterium halophytorum]
MTNLTPPPAGGNETPDALTENRAPDAAGANSAPDAPSGNQVPAAGSTGDGRAVAPTGETPRVAVNGSPAEGAAAQGGPGPSPWGEPQGAPPAYGSPYATGAAHPGAASGGGVPPAGGPTPPAAGGPVPPQSETARIGTRAVAITATAIGAVVLLFAGAGAAFGAVRDSVAAANQANGVDSGTLAHAVDGITAVDVDHGFGDMRIVFGDVDEAELEWSGTREWRLEREGATLEVRREGDGFGFGDFTWFGDWDQEHRATLTLPESLEGADLDIETGAGSVNAEGDFGDVSFDLGAGSVEIEGSATSVDGEVSAGEAIVELADVREFDAQVSAGDLMASLSGEAPSRVGIEVSAGSADITLPDVEYDVRESVSAGGIDTNNLQTSFDAPRVVEADVSAGGIDLRAG